jgi:hypothetical protein
MPTITSRRTGPVARRQRRRARQRQKRLSIIFPHRQRNHRRSIPKRQRREQSADVDECFEDCQELGYHLDPDVHVGSLAAQGSTHTSHVSSHAKLTTPAGNPFSTLDPDYSSQSTPDPIPTPYQDHTIRPPNPFLAELEWHVAKKSYPKLEDIGDPIFPDAEDQEDQPPHASRFWWRSPFHPDDLEANRSSISKVHLPTVQATIPPSVQRSSIPTTPPSGGNVHLPGTFPQDNTPADTYRPSKKRKLNDAATPSFLTGYRIPSPFLYHKPSRDALPNIGDEENMCICLGPSFGSNADEHQNTLRHNNCSSSCGESSAELELEATQPLLGNQYQFVAAALPNMDTGTFRAPVEEAVGCADPEFYTNTRPYLSPRKTHVDSEIATGSSATCVRGSVPLLAKVKNLTSHIYAAEDLRLTDTPLPAHGISPVVASSPEQPSAPQHSQSVFSSHELVFPQLPAPTGVRHKSLDRYIERTVNFWSKQQDGHEQRKIGSDTLKKDIADTTKEKRSNFQELWDAYEKAVLGQNDRESCAPRAVISKASYSGPDRSSLPLANVIGPERSSAVLHRPINPARPASIDLKIPKEIEIPAWSLSPCTALVPARLFEKQYLGLTGCWSFDNPCMTQTQLPMSNAIVKQINESYGNGKIQQAMDWLTEDLHLDKIFDEEQDEDGAYLPWLQAGWDGNLFFPENTASEVPLPLSTPFEDVELGDEGQFTDSDSWGGMQINEEANGSVCWEDWDDDASGWSEPSEDEFFDFFL